MDNDDYDEAYRRELRRLRSGAPLVDLADDGFGSDPCEGIFPDICPRPVDERPLARVLPFRRRTRG